MSKADPPIKFLSFHAYIRKLTSGLDKLVDMTNIIMYLLRKSL